MDAIITNSLIIMLILGLLVTIATLLRRNKTIIELKKQALLDKAILNYDKVFISDLEAEIHELKLHIGQINQSDREATSYLIAKVNGVYYSPSRDEIVTIDDPELIRIGDLY